MVPVEFESVFEFDYYLILKIAFPHNWSGNENRTKIDKNAWQNATSMILYIIL